MMMRREGEREEGRDCRGWKAERVEPGEDDVARAEVVAEGEGLQLE